MERVSLAYISQFRKMYPLAWRYLMSYMQARHTNGPEYLMYTMTMISRHVEQSNLVFKDEAYLEAISLYIGSLGR